MTTGDLFGRVTETLDAHQAFARRTDPEPSHEAAAKVKTADLEQIVLDALASLGPSTTEQLAAFLGISLVTISPRLKPLEGKGRVVRDGKRKNASGVSATVWMLV